MKKILVLLSSYNGEEYISEQINSILNQDKVEMTLIIRDDGSTDKTVEIIKKFLVSHRNIELIEGDNIGISQSFYELSKYAKFYYKEYDFYSFSDQDDFWEKEKLWVAANHLSEMNNSVPNLYYSNLKLVDGELNYLRKLYNENQVKNTKEQALAQVFTFGCTCVFNRKALNDFVENPQLNLYHDNWIFMICIFLGNVYYDHNSFILYRQHGQNASGVRHTGLSLWFERGKKLLNVEKMGTPFENMTIALLENFGEQLTIEDKKIIELVAFYRKNIFKKLSLLFSRKITAGYISKDICIKLRVLLNKV